MKPGETRRGEQHKQSPQEQRGARDLPERENVLPYTRRRVRKTRPAVGAGITERITGTTSCESDAQELRSARNAERKNVAHNVEDLRPTKDQRPRAVPSALEHVGGGSQHDSKEERDREEMGGNRPGKNDGAGRVVGGSGGTVTGAIETDEDYAVESLENSNSQGGRVSGATGNQTKE